MAAPKFSSNHVFINFAQLDPEKRSQAAAKLGSLSDKLVKEAGGSITVYLPDGETAAIREGLETPAEIETMAAKTCNMTMSAGAYIHGILVDIVDSYDGGDSTGRSAAPAKFCFVFAGASGDGLRGPVVDESIDDLSVEAAIVMAARALHGRGAPEGQVTISLCAVDPNTQTIEDMDYLVGMHTGHGIQSMVERVCIYD